jgi:hypothetical protein
MNEKFVESLFEFSTVKLELTIDELFLILQLLDENGHKERIKYTIVQLYVEEHLTRENAYKLAEHCGINDFSL